MNPFSAWTAVGAVPCTRGWSEQALVTLMWGEHTRALQTRFKPLFLDLLELGPLNVVTTNRVGALHIQADLTWHHGNDGAGCIGTDTIDIDIDFGHINAIVATGTQSQTILSRAIRLFDPYGDVAVSVSPTPALSSTAYQSVVDRYTRCVAPLLPDATPQPARPRPRRIVDIDGALKRWTDSGDRQALETLLVDHRLTRQHLYRTASDSRASAISRHEVVQLLRWMIARKAPIQFQVGRPGVAAVARVIPEAVAVRSQTIELAGSAAVLRLDPAHMDHAWVVTHDTPDGPQRNIELLDEAGELAVRLGTVERAAAARSSRQTCPPIRPGP